MDETAQRNLAVVLTVVALLAFAGVFYLAFVFPHTVAVWRENAQTLSAAERMLVSLSMFCKSYGLLLLPLLMAASGACALWAWAGRTSKAQPRF